ncbi:MAG: IclR family transcriptional regulator C-terminal domain-containing protein, partial [Pseudomonadota bacterium]
TGPLSAFTAATVTDPAALRTRLETIRADGFNISVDDLDEGAFSIAAPILNATGEVIAAISVAGAIARYDEIRRARYLATVRAAAEEISAKLGIAVPA